MNFYSYSDDGNMSTPHSIWGAGMMQSSFEPSLVTEQQYQPQYSMVSDKISVYSAPEPKSVKGMAPLPRDFKPTDDSVILGRGKGSYNHTGNKRCRIIVKSLLPQYNKVDTRHEKAEIVSNVLLMIKQRCPIGAFVKLHSDRWYEVDDKTAREKCFTMFRDCQNSELRESAKSSASSNNGSIKKQKQKKSEVVSTKTTEEIDISIPLLVNSSSNIFVKNKVKNETEEECGSFFDFTDIAFDLMSDGDESISSSICGSFYDIDSCSYCSI